jgi:serine/threonine protein kinase
MLLTSRNEIKLADLGISKLMDKTHASSYAGSPVYMSPEIFKAQFMEMKYYPNTDIWYFRHFLNLCLSV